MATVLWPTDKILLLLFIVTAMMSITLQVTLRQIVAVLHDKALVIRALVANFVLVPLLGSALVNFLPMAPDVKNGILLLALAPGELLAINFTRRVCGRIELAAALLFLLTFTGAVFTPILAKWILPSELPVSVPYGKLIKAVVLYIALPLIAGLALNKFFPRLATALQKPLNILSGLAFVAFAIATGSLKSSAAKTIAGGGALLGLALLIVGAMVLGWVLGGSDAETRRVLSVNTGMRNLAICLAIATNTFPETNVDLTIIAFAALAIPIAVLFTLYQKRKIKKIQRTLAHQTAGAA